MARFFLPLIVCFSLLLFVIPFFALVFAQACTDLDGDGYGNPGDAICPNGSQTDCDDDDDTVFPGAPVLCDGLDNNCDGWRDYYTDRDEDLDGVPWCAGDCDDTDPLRFPGNQEG